MKYRKVLRRLFFLLILFFGAILSGFAQHDIKAFGKYLCIDYKPFFPIGLYHFPDERKDDAIWKEVAETGFNFVLSQESGKYGMYVSKQIPRKTIGERKYSLMEVYRDQSMFGELKSFLAENETDTTMLCWHAPDEPSWFGPTANVLRLGYEAIKTYSKKPVWLNIGPTFTTRWHYNMHRDFVSALDVLSEDIYPIPDGKRKSGQANNIHAYNVGEPTEKLVEMGSVEGVQNTPVWMVLQGFGWGDLPFDNPADFVPPTFHELPFMTYDAIVHGASGLLSYGPFSTESAVNTQFWLDLKEMASELRELYPLLTCPNELLAEKLNIEAKDASTENLMKCLIKLMEEKVCIIAVNTRPEPLNNVTFSVIDRDEGQLTEVNVLTEDRQIEVSDHKSWIDDFEGYGVHIYETDIYFTFMRRYYEPSVKSNE